MESNFELFLGRFHPLIVHLPIGFLILAILLDIISVRWHRESPKLDKAVAYAYLLGGITGLMAVGTGWLLAGSGGYTDPSVQWHRWLGVSVTLLSFCAWALKSKKPDLPAAVYRTNVILLAGTLIFTGHLGGNLTHGSGFLLEHAPQPIRTLFGGEDGSPGITLPNNPDSVLVYAHLIKPILELKCMSCHNSGKTKGGLDMSAPESFREGGDEGAAIVAGQPFESGIFQRTTLPFNHAKYMPPNGRPLEYHEIKLLEWWISEGASFDSQISDVGKPEDIMVILLDRYGLDVRPRPFFETTEIEVLQASIWEGLTENGFKGRTLSESNNYVTVSPTSLILAEGSLESLLNASTHIVDLDLSRTNLDDSRLAIVGKLENLYSLNLNNTGITDEGLKSIADLPKLAILNLYGTAVTDTGLEVLKNLPALKKVYLWQTDVTTEFVSQWQSESEIEIVMGE